MREQGGGVVINVIGDNQPAGEPGQRIATMISQLGLVRLTLYLASDAAIRLTGLVLDAPFLG
jgi:hypothetical protein